MRPDGKRSWTAEARRLAALAIPIAASQLGLVALGLVDVAILGHVSVTDLAGAALARTVGFSAAALTTGIALSLEPLVSQAVGAGDLPRASAALRACERALVLGWLLSTAVSVAIVRSLPRFGVEQDVATRAFEYLLGQAPGFLFYGHFLAHRTFLSAHGRTRPGMAAVVAANLINVFACTLLIRGDDALADAHLPRIGLPHLGAFGAGLASTLAYGVLAWSMRRASRTSTVPTAVHLPMGKVFRVGAPIGLSLFAEMSVFSLAAVLVGTMGKSIMSAHQIAIALASFTYMGAVGVAAATAVVVGKDVGAGIPVRRAGLVGMLLGAAWMVAPAVVFATAPRLVASLFTGDPTVGATAVSLLRIAAVFQLFDGIQAAAAGALRGAGDVRAPLVVNLAAYWMVGLPVGLLLAFGAGMRAVGLWLGLTLGIGIASVVLPIRFLRVARELDSARGQESGT